ncbi:MAG: polyisoprenoid-binding protein [Betaproteobacteria bacterium]|nr:polyisoprenoid-binding protein [Betaproteobacteria bacterium]
MELRAGLVAISLLLAAPAAAAPDTYVVDVPHSFSNFEVGHLGITWIRGRFNKMTGKITLDRAEKQGSIEAEIDTSSVDTGHVRRDELLRTEDYFNVSQFPTITFRSTSLRFSGETPVGADGELTMLGVTRPVSLEITSFKCIVHPVNKREICGAVASTIIQRSAFGMTRVSRSISDEIRIYINVEGYKS